jgi:hypothetical protein
MYVGTVPFFTSKTVTPLAAALRLILSSLGGVCSKLFSKNAIPKTPMAATMAHCLFFIQQILHFSNCCTTTARQFDAINVYGQIMA